MKGTALITGSAKRLGREIAFELAELNYNIAIHYNTSYQKAQELLQLFEKQKVQCSLYQANLENISEIENLIHQVKNEFPDFNLLVNSASVFQRINLLNTDETIFNSNFNINFKAPFFLIKEFAVQCKNGHIINMVDSKIAHNDINYIAYTLSKKALGELTTISAKELAPNIRVNGIAPGYILPPDTESQNYLIKRPEKILLKRKGDPKEIRKTIRFLIENEFLTGQIIYVDGGDHL